MADPARPEWSADDLAGLSEAADVVSARVQARLAEVEVARVQRLAASHNQVHDMIARAVPLREVLTTACEAIERYDPSLMVSVLQRDPETNALHSGVGPSFPQAYFDAAEGTPIGPATGTGVAQTRLAAGTGHQARCATASCPCYPTTGCQSKRSHALLATPEDHKSPRSFTLKQIHPHC